MDNDDSGLGCGCLTCVLITGAIIIAGWRVLNPNANSLEIFLFSAFIISGIVLIFLSVITSKFHNLDTDGENIGCLGVILKALASVFSVFKHEDVFADTSIDSSSTSTESHVEQHTDDIKIGNVAQPTVQTSGNSTSIAENPPKPAVKKNPPKKEIIDTKLFNKTKVATNKLINFCYDLAKDKDLRDYLAQVASDGGNAISPDIEYINRLFVQLAMNDVFDCMAKIGYPIDSLSTKNYSALIGGGSMNIKLNSYEGQVLFTLIFITESRYASYGDFATIVSNALKNRTSQEVNNAESNLYKYATSTTNVSTDAVNDYQLPIVLRSISRDKDSQEYKKILYDIVSCFAYADGVLTNKEKAFLKKLGSDAGIADLGITVDAAPDVSLDSLNSLIGLKEVKQSITSLVNFISVNQKRKEMGMKVPSVSYHCVFTGNPGTGKTTVARILAGIYRNLGILQTGQLVETDRSGLVAEYVGQTAIKTNKIIDSAIGGVLFIDEAYSLVGGGNEDYGKEAISTLLKRMEDDRDKLVVILAGYSKEMEDFINSNPGLRSRFSRYIHFPDYSADELFQIFQLNMQKFDYHLTDDGESYLKRVLERRVAHKPSDFGNAREVRNLFEKVVEAQSDRLQRMNGLTKEAMSEFTLEDLQRACEL